MILVVIWKVSRQATTNTAEDSKPSRGGGERLEKVKRQEDGKVEKWRTEN